MSVEGTELEKSRTWLFDQDQNHRLLVKMTAELHGFPELLSIPRSFDELVRLGYDSRILDMVLYTLLHMKPVIITQIGDGYQWIGARTEQRDLHAFEMQRRWLRLEEVLMSGKPAGTLEPWFLDILTDTMRLSSLELMPSVVDFVKRHTSPHATGIDIGGSHGLFSKNMMIHGYDMTVLDLPFVVQKASKHSPELNFIGHNILEEPLTAFDQAYDFALMIRFVHMHGPIDIATIIENARPAMAPHAKWIVIDTVRGISPNADVFAINMGVNTPHGNTYSVADMERFSGLRCTHQELLPALGYAGLIFEN
ncbi:methyltransferase [Sulfoacidibacillus ferrooxidans]|uniref:O-methyltransferase C-terminal domain-containing protein n=1 Tax=Sulfoacidibacillus ferrooxidans TaxID=2005001 RepID=A0A9X1V7F4_9BACL|nr:methyltransferase [Sulfoacidibacillus ferrooxidans]MCI0182389.1 hypothetical protein [Sulfoacidibacillus ferrooxidans]